MKISDHFTTDSRGFLVTAICGLAFVGVLVQYFWNISGTYDIDVLMLIFGISGVLINRILPPSGKVARPRFRNLRLVTESLFTIGLVGVIVSWVFYETRTHFLELLMLPTIILAAYLLIKYGFGPHANDREGESAS
jgi:hypothetical protein